MTLYIIYFRGINANVISLLEKLTRRNCVFLKPILIIHGYIQVISFKTSLRKVKVKLVLQVTFKLYLFNSFKTKFDRVKTSSKMFDESIKYWKRAR